MIYTNDYIDFPKFKVTADNLYEIVSDLILSGELEYHDHHISDGFSFGAERDEPEADNDIKFLELVQFSRKKDGV